MPTNTPNINLSKPDVGGDDDVWGGFLNSNSDILDSEIQDLKDAAVPIGTIVMWHDTVLSIPNAGTDWGYCDGTVYTRTDGGGSITSPDLRGLFVVASTGDALGDFPTGTFDADGWDGDPGGDKDFGWHSLVYMMKL